MEHENADEAIAFQTACKNVKQIANTIKAIRMKYYPNFANISDDDRETYNRLHAQIDEIAQENGLVKLKKELIADIEDRFNTYISQDVNKQEKKTEQSEKVLKAYYGAIDAGRQALSEGRLKRALNCQKQADYYMMKLEKLKNDGLMKIALHYKREKFASLSLEQRKGSVTNWDDFLKGTYRAEDLQKRNSIAHEILLQDSEIERQEEGKKDTRKKDISEMLIET